jgi:hypothetical protein
MSIGLWHPSPMADAFAALTCPVCKHVESMTMPADRCVIAHECRACHTVLKPKAGDCCVFCSFADKRCPFVQDERECPGNTSTL